MATRFGMLRTLMLSVCCVIVGGSCGNDDPEPPPRQMDSGFRFLDHAFSFPNYGGDLNPQLTPDLVARMCGEELVCENGALPCEIKPVAKRWMESTNVTLEEGRSEGFAVLSLMFFAGHLDSNDFGGITPASLRLYQNTALQDELSYWAATQAVPSATKNDKRFNANKVLPFLAGVLSPTSDKRYRLAIAQRTETGFARGHALTPIGYYKGEGDVYWLRVYDNNFPQKERLLEINPAANTWRYEFDGVDGTPIVYEGTPENKNQLYFSAIEDRLGTLVCPFDPKAETHTLAYSGMTVVETTDDGAQTGIVDGVVIEEKGGRVTPAFSSCPRCGENVQVINQRSIAAGVSALRVSSTGDVNTSVTENGAQTQITGTGPSYTTTAYPQGSTKNDAVTFGSDGNVTYRSQSSQTVRIVSTHTLPDGTTEEVSVQVAGGTPGQPVEVTVSRAPNGEAQIDVKGAPKGSSVTVVVGNSAGESESITYTSTGEDSAAMVNPTTGDVQAQNVDNLSGGSCINGVKDPSESDVDCGGNCNGCNDRKSCRTDADCLYDHCNPSKVCAALHCGNGVKDASETSVDCGGGTCNACTAPEFNQLSPELFAAGPTCAAHSDCDSGRCSGQSYNVLGRCVSKHDVVLRLNQVGNQNISRQFSYMLDGVESMIRVDRTTPDGPYEFVLGKANSFRLTGLGNDGQCSSVQMTTQYTGRDNAADVELRGIINVQCESNRAILKGQIHYKTNVGLPATDPLRLEVTYDNGAPQQVLMNGRLANGTPYNTFIFGTYATNWSARIVGQPTGQYMNPATGRAERMYCVLNTRDGLYNYDPTKRRQVEVSCDWASNGTCEDGVQSANMQESDVDCGGPFCNKCPDGKYCRDNNNNCEHQCHYTSVCYDKDKLRDGIQNQGETGIDCGGPFAYRCAQGFACASGRDCLSGSCINNTCCAGADCIIQSCSDGVKSGHEADVDCGGFSFYRDTCQNQKCAIGKNCGSNEDCVSGYCSGSVCTNAPCTDGQLNGLETAVDCGGPACAQCPVDTRCLLDRDCASGSCLRVPNNLGNTVLRCVVNSCSTFFTDGAETDVDCGGPDCNGCAAGKACVSGGDCLSRVCNAGFCATANCADGTVNGIETDVDCGGNCNACGTAKACRTSTDCASQACDGGFCRAPSCTDGVKNGAETGTDCGGPCAKCPLGESCGIGADCASGLCDLFNVCVGGICTDGVKNGAETDVDCGGSTCGACGVGKICVTNTDCAAGACSGGFCAGPSCTDGLKNGAETDIDCGGGTCGLCLSGAVCNTGADCNTFSCVGSVCATASCSDGIKNGTETDIDCGGTCGGCGIGLSCSGNSDCTDGFCAGTICAAPSCTDTVKNGTETDVDCGGSCGPCAPGNACSLDGDCTTNNCWCSGSFGNCAGAGICGGVKTVIDTPTTDGFTASGTFTVPAQCSSIHIQAWGAAGGRGEFLGSGQPGGAGGFVSGTLSVASGDVFTVWIGQGGAVAEAMTAGTPGIGSNLGSLASGGAGAGSIAFMEASGSGGGATSVQQSGSGFVTFVVPAGSGASRQSSGADVTNGLGGGNFGPSGENAPSAGDGGGGAGEQGGSFGWPGSYSALDPGLSAMDGGNGTPAATSSPDYALCLGLTAGSPGAGAGSATSDSGGDGCVVIRCIAP